MLHENKQTTKTKQTKEQKKKIIRKKGKNVPVAVM